jgi:tetratricopeptide (TPR) repeat protein
METARLTLLMVLYLGAWVPGRGAAQPSADTEADVEARALFSAGVVAYDAGRYEAALESFEHAYELSDRPALLYNMGQCYDRLRRDHEALDAFQRYLEAVPESDNHAQVEVRIRALQQAIEQRQTANVTPEVVAQAAEPALPTADMGVSEAAHTRTRRIALIASSAVVVVAAVVLTVVLAGRGSGHAPSDAGTVFALRGATP